MLDKDEGSGSDRERCRQTGPLEVFSTWKVIKQFQLRANATGHLPNVEPRISLTILTPKALANFSPGLERSDNPGEQIHHQR